MLVDTFVSNKNSSHLYPTMVMQSRRLTHLHEPLKVPQARRLRIERRVAGVVHVHKMSGLPKGAMPLTTVPPHRQRVDVVPQLCNLGDGGIDDHPGTSQLGDAIIIEERRTSE